MGLFSVCEVFTFQETFTSMQSLSPFNVWIHFLLLWFFTLQAIFNMIFVGQDKFVLLPFIDVKEDLIEWLVQQKYKWVN